MPSIASHSTVAPSTPHEGYFPPGASVLRRVHEERAVGLMFGQRALAVGAIKPLNFIGTMEHSGHKRDPFKRLTRTAVAFEKIFFGTRDEADGVLKYVRKMHARVNGETPEAAGIYPAGTSYSALDPALMVWTVAAMMDSAEVMHDLLVRRLSDEEREALWQDYRRLAGLFGTPQDALPRDYRAFREYFSGELAAADVHLTEQARYVGWFSAFAIPSRRLRGPVLAAHNLLVLGSLPPEVRALYGLGFRGTARWRFAVLAGMLRAARRAMPQSVACGENSAVFESIAREEARRLRVGQPTPFLHADGSPGTPGPPRKDPSRHH